MAGKGWYVRPTFPRNKSKIYFVNLPLEPKKYKKAKFHSIGILILTFFFLENKYDIWINHMTT